jgi:hypothetical protein
VVDEISVFELKVVFLLSVPSLPTPDCTYNPEKCKALQAGHLPSLKTVGKWNGMEGKRAQWYFMETLLYSQGIFGRYSDLRISYKSTFACPLRSLR